MSNSAVVGAQCECPKSPARVMQMVHELPGTTFSGTADRSGYDSGARAVMTLGWGDFDPDLPTSWIIAATVALGHAAGEEVRAGRITSAQADAILQNSLQRLFAG